MLIAALLLRPWAQSIGSKRVKAGILVDDIMLVAQGTGMTDKFTKALHYTHEYLQDMGAAVAPAKSINFSSNARARGWPGGGDPRAIYQPRAGRVG